jgi:cell wall-associated NlpC family hydrolase
VLAERALVYARSGRQVTCGIDCQAAFGVLVGVSERMGLVSIQTPEGDQKWVASHDLLPLEQHPKLDAEGIAYTLDLIKRFIGIPYLWGGRSTFGYDCSGLAQAFFSFMGVAIPRDADLQCRDGRLVTGEPEPGDLLFFGKAGVGLADIRFSNVTHSDLL